MANNIVSGSPGFMPNTNDLMVDSAPGAEEANCQPRSGKRQHFAQHHPDDASPFGAESHSNADFVRAARHRVRHSAVEADTCDRKRENRERSTEIRKRSFLVCVVDALRLRHHARDRDGRRGVMNHLPNCLGERKGLACRPQLEKHAGRTLDHVLQVRRYATGGMASFSEL